MIVGLMVKVGKKASEAKRSLVKSFEESGEEFLPPKKRARGRSSFSTSALPRVFENEESSHKTSLERHEEQNEEILIHLDELSLDRIEHMEDKIEGFGSSLPVSSTTLPPLDYPFNKSIFTKMPPKRTSTSAAPAMTQAAIRKLTVDLSYSQDPKSSQDDGFKASSNDGKKVDEDPSKGSECKDQEKQDNINRSNNMDVKSAFLYGKIKEEVYVCQPPGFEDPKFLDRVYKVENALYGLHQAPRAWYETLSTYLLNKGFQKGKIDKTLFIKRHKGDILLVQVYVDDIISSLTRKKLYNAFKRLMHEKIQMSSMGELTFFLGLQVKQNNGGIFISQDKYVAEILKKFGFTKVKNASTPMETQKPLLKDEDGEEVDVHMYRSIIGSLMYLTSSRPHIMFVVFPCARYQVNPKVSHIHVVKRIFRYLKGHPKLGLWYPKDSPFDLVAYTNSDDAGASLDIKSTIGGYRFLGCRLISWQFKKQTLVANSITKVEYFWSTAMAKTINGESQIQVKVHGKEIIITELFVRRDLRLADEVGVDCLPNSTIFENLKFLGPKTTTWNEFSSTMASAIICLATNQKFNFSKFIFDSMIRNLDNVSCKFLMYPRVGKGFSCRITNLFPCMLVQNLMGKGSALTTDPQYTPTILQPSSSQHQKTQKPRKPKRNNTQVPQPCSSTKHVIDKAVYKELDDKLVRAAITSSSLKAEHDIGNIDKTQSKATPNEASSPRTTSGGGLRCQDTMGDIIAQTRFENVSKLSNDSLLTRGNKLRSDGDRMQLNELMELCTNLQSKGRKINDIDVDEDITLVNDQDDAEIFDVNDLHGETVIVEKEVADKKVSAAGEVNVASIATTISAATTITTKEITLAQALDKGKGITVEEPVKLKKKDQVRLDEEKRRKFFATKRGEEKRNKPPTQAQQRKIMCTYIKNMEGKKLVEGSLKRAGEELTQESAKKKKEDDDKETAELKELMEIIPDKEEVAIDDVPLSVILRIYEAFGSILLVFMKLLMKKLDDFREEFQVYRRIVGIKSHLNVVGITAAHIDVNTVLRS
nr:putative ribonuclease H-like domain-containing protein [Tanacetum cinerariifolium]